MLRLFPKTAAPLGEPFSPIDASFFSLDSSTTRQVIAAFCPLDTLPDLDALEARFQTLLGIFPRLMCKVMHGRPLRWIKDEAFSLQNHLCFRYVPEMQSPADLMRVASEEFTRGLEAARPLWRFLVISNTKEQQDGTNTISGVLFCLHHALADGLAGLEILNTLFARTREASVSDFCRARGGSRETKTGASLSVAALWPSLRKIAEELVVPRGCSLFNGPNSSARELRTFDFPLEDIRRVKSRLGCTVNDVILGVLAAAVQRYHQTQAQMPACDLRVIMPVSLRRISARRTLGNHLSAVGVRLPVSLGDPLEQLAAVSRYVSRLKATGAFGAYALLGRLNARLPTAVQTYFCRAQARRTNFICTNMPGSPSHQYLAGARVEGSYGLAALLEGHGISFAFISYVGKVCASIVSDPQIIRNPEALFHHIREVLSEVLTRLGESAERRAPFAE